MARQGDEGYALVEILAEILIQLLWGAVEILGELLLQVVFEWLGEAVAHRFKKAGGDRKPVSPWLAAIGYACAGAAAGAVSLLIFPHLMMGAEWMRVLNLIMTPIAAGAIMAAMGAWRRRHEKEVVRLDSFAYGYLFALAMAIVRFTWGA